MTNVPNPTTISAIITTYNNALYLREAIDSVLAQTRPASEIIVVDDASTDDTPSIMAEYTAKHPHIRYERMAENSGTSRVRNRGVECATGDYLAFLDADDRWMPEKLQLQADALDTTPDLDVIFGHVRQFISDDLDETERQQIALPNPIAPAYVPGGMLIRRAIFLAVGQFFDQRDAYDFSEWYVRAREQCLGERLLPDIILERRIHRTNITRTYSKSFYLHAMKRNLDLMRTLPALPETLRTILETETVYDTDGTSYKLFAHLDDTACYILQHFIRRLRASRIIEIGFAYGISALAIGAITEPCLHLDYHIIDPYQESLWHNIGVENMRRAGFDGRYTLHQELSELELPRMLAAGKEFDFAFIDGNHTFDHALIDFFYVNRMLKIGGIVVFDDYPMPALTRLAAYIEKYPAYQKLELPTELTIDGVKTTLPPCYRLVAFQRIDYDTRQWDWYAEF